MEDIISRLRHRPPHRRHLPLVASIDVFVDGKYLSKEDVDIQIEDYRELYGQGKKVVVPIERGNQNIKHTFPFSNQFVLKLNAKLATNLGELNDLVSFVARYLSVQFSAMVNCLTFRVTDKWKEGLCCWMRLLRGCCCWRIGLTQCSHVNMYFLR